MMPPPAYSLAVFCYILFGYPAYECTTTIHKGIVFGRANSGTIWVYIRRAEYFVELAALNGAPSVEMEVPLSDNGGVWMRRRK